MTVPENFAVRVADLRSEALRARAVRLATCCTPSGARRALSRAVSAVRRFARHGNLAVARPCCPWPT
ncbi:MAG: hypothetical protein JWO60_3108 [Frankiales bacterium]|nr:hypothetical protein [Frankiales bacterium]